MTPKTLQQLAAAAVPSEDLYRDDVPHAVVDIIIIAQVDRHYFFTHSVLQLACDHDYAPLMALAYERMGNRWDFGVMDALTMDSYWAAPACREYMKDHGMSALVGYIAD